MIIDDSAVVRQVMTGVLGADPGVEVIGAVADPLFAMERMKRQWPDVILLDVEMPRMDGITFLRKIMSERPTPVVICSTLTEAGCGDDARSAGRRRGDDDHQAEGGPQRVSARRELGARRNAIRVAAEGELCGGVRRRLQRAVAVSCRGEYAHPLRAAAGGVARRRFRRARRRASDAGRRARKELSRCHSRADAREGDDAHDRAQWWRSAPRRAELQALEHVLAQLPAVCPGHRDRSAHAARVHGRRSRRDLNNLCEIEVREAKNNDRVIPGCALIAPGGKHLLLKRSGAQYYVEVKEGPPVNRHCPSVDVLFRSAAACAGANALGIIMTGMGDDGARGLKEMRDAGAHTIAQDEASCVVFGMPREAIRLDAAERVMSLDDLSGAVLAH